MNVALHANGTLHLHPNTKVLEFQGLFVFLDYHLFTIAHFFRPFELEGAKIQSVFCGFYHEFSFLIDFFHPLDDLFHM